MIFRAFALTAIFLPFSAFAQTAADLVSAADIESAGYLGGDLPSGRSALTAKIQILLDRSGTSPGVIDGFRGGMSESAIKAFERRAGLPIDGIMDPLVWNLLQPYSETPLTHDYTIADNDAQGIVASIPTDYAEKAQMAELGFTSIAEKLGERFHMDEKFIAVLNPGVPLVPGSTIRVVTPAPPIKGEVTRIIVDKATRRVAGYNASGGMVVDYPATVGSDSTPSPAGDHTVVTIALNPNYTYNPTVNFKQGENDKVLTIPPGPNGPVGTVWIDLSKPTYGIHGTPTPSQLFRNQSRGCVRLTNWDAQELAKLVKPGVTRVEFLPPGVTIADVTGVIQPAIATAEPLAIPATPGAPITTLPASLPGTVEQTVPATLPHAFPGDPLGTVTADPSKTFEDTTESEPSLPAGSDPLASDPLLDALNSALQGLPAVGADAVVQ